MQMIKGKIPPTEKEEKDIWNAHSGSVLLFNDFTLFPVIIIFFETFLKLTSAFGVRPLESKAEWRKQRCS